MSLDLWTKFVDGPEDPSENPWAQTASQGESQVTDRNGIRYLDALPASQIPGGSDTSHTRQTEWGGSFTDGAQPTHNIEMSPGFGTENVWTTPHSYREELPPWPVFEDLSHVTRLSRSSSPHHGIAEEDDFGDFETPDVPQPFVGTVLRDLPLSTPKEMQFDQGEISRASAILPQCNKTLSQQEHDPYSDIEKLEKPPPHQIPRSESQDVDMSSWRPSPTKKMDTPFIGPPPVENRASLSTAKNVDDPYEVEEWEEFSPDPHTDSGLNEEIVLPVKPRKDQLSTSASRSPRRLVPEPKDMEHSRQSPVSKNRIMSSRPPSNIPPPSILISHMSTLIQRLPSQVEAVMLQSSECQIAQEALDKALHGCIASLRVSARIIAGRKVRWKRDSHLSQSMKIGPAQVGKKGGMKLTGVDKAETQREDREVAEFVRIWKQRLGSIRAALAKVNSQISGSPLVLPEISERMIMIVAKATEGSVSSSKSCTLCGLKREERVAKVDVDIWDGFEEWWSDFWGHTECRTFWEEHERFLQQR